MKKIIVFGALAALLAACAQTSSDPVDPVSAAVSGKALVDGADRFEVRSDGSLYGVGGPDRTEFFGAWTVRDGKWCRTLTAPASFVGTACQDTVVNDDGTITITGRNGPRTWTIVPL